MRRAMALLGVCATAPGVAACSTAAERGVDVRSADVAQPGSAPAASAADRRDPLRLSALQAPHDGITPSDVRRLVPNALATRFHISFSTARLAIVARAQPIFVARGAGAYCLIDRARSLTNCWSDETTQRGDAAVSSICSPQLMPSTIELGGIVPNGVHTVTIPRGGRFRPETVKVHNNVFIAVLPAGNPLPLSLLFYGERPEHSTGIPRGTTYAPCGPRS